MSSPKLSNRAEEIRSKDISVNKYQNEAIANAYHETNNPKGIVNLGTACNYLMQTEVQERFARPDVFKFNAEQHQHYYDFCGTRRLRLAVCDFLGRNVSGGLSLDPKQLVVLNGATSCFDVLGWALLDAGSVLLTPTPTYYSVFNDFVTRPGLDVQPLHLRVEDDFALTASMLEARILELKSLGKTVRAFLLINPNNPLGRNYDQATVEGLLGVCAKYEIHVIVDEIYALSQLHSENSFRSILSFPSLPDPERTHFVWGVSKDFGLAGLRIGVILSRNRPLLEYLETISFYHCTPSVVQDALAVVLEDVEWCDKFYIPTNSIRLRNSFETVQTAFTDEGIEMVKPDAALFCFVNLTAYLKEVTWEEEARLFRSLYAAGVHTTAGCQTGHSQPGWFRVVFSVGPSHLRTGIDRILTVLREEKLKLHQDEKTKS